MELTVFTQGRGLIHLSMLKADTYPDTHAWWWTSSRLSAGARLATLTHTCMSSRLMTMLYRHLGVLGGHLTTVIYLTTGEAGMADARP